MFFDVGKYDNKQLTLYLFHSWDTQTHMFSIVEPVYATLPKFNMEPENGTLKQEIPAFQKPIFLDSSR